MWPLTDVWGSGGAGGEALAKEVIRLSEGRSTMEFVYDTNLPIKGKIEAIAARGTGADRGGVCSKGIKGNEESGEPGIWKSACLYG